MIEPNATQLKAQAIEVHRTGQGKWNLYDATGHLHAQLASRDDAVEAAHVKFHVRAAEWRTVATECACKGDDFCSRCGGHGELYTAHAVLQ